jgi:hypothetical protein
MMLIIAMSATAQQNSVTDRLNKTGQVKVDAPKELEKRNNANLNKQQTGNKDKDKKVKDKDKDKKKTESDEEKLNELDDDTKQDVKDEKKKDEKKNDETVLKKPKRQHTSQKTIESRGVGFRIQAYSDNQSTAKAAAQQRARDIAMKFPQYRSYISYKAPSWRLRIGDFKTQKEAQEALRRIKSVYPKFAREMVIVRDRINVWSND